MVLQIFQENWQNNLIEIETLTRGIVNSQNTTFFNCNFPSSICQNKCEIFSSSGSSSSSSVY